MQNILLATRKQNYSEGYNTVLASHTLIMVQYMTTSSIRSHVLHASKTTHPATNYIHVKIA